MTNLTLGAEFDGVRAKAIAFRDAPIYPAEAWNGGTIRRALTLRTDQDGHHYDYSHGTEQMDAVAVYVTATPEPDRFVWVDDRLWIANMETLHDALELVDLLVTEGMAQAEEAIEANEMELTG